HRGPHVRGHAVGALLPRRRGDHERLRRPPALGKAPFPDRRDARLALPEVGGVPARPRPARPGPVVRERLHAAGSRCLGRRRAGGAGGGGPGIVPPTYDGAGNIEALAGAVRGQLAAEPGRYEILIVDDNSPDGTGEIADKLAAGSRDVEVLHRKIKEGLGPAY